MTYHPSIKAATEHHHQEEPFCDKCFNRCPHGTRNGYGKWHCRCVRCKKAQASFDYARKEAQHIYAFYFESEGLLKIGSSASQPNYRLIRAKRQLKDKDLFGEDGVEIWRNPGDVKEEHWMQAHFAYIYDPAFQGTSMSEWFIVSRNPDTLKSELDRVYSTIPIGQ